MDPALLRDLQSKTAAIAGSWWRDDRRNWRAYCGIPMRRRRGKGGSQPPTLATRDHVIPKAHDGGLLTIPACRSCNAAKGRLSLPEFLETDAFRAVRRHRHRHQWPLHDLWTAVGIAALRKVSVLAVAAKSVETASAPSAVIARAAASDPSAMVETPGRGLPRRV
ncbi:HNH endonuclease [Jiella sp. M17.18]|uniref:HNH endonuclease n=1 Tax=Jiella sp. M17.18 TaxID=3234247 RepID=UPI0034DFBA6A